MKAKQAIILIDHGSQLSAAAGLLDQMAPLVAGRLAVRTFAAHMDLIPPTLADAFEAACQYGAEHIVVFPFFLASGRHVTHDIPAQIDQARAARPGVTVELADSLGVDELLADLAAKRIRPHLRP